MQSLHFLKLLLVPLGLTRKVTVAFYGSYLLLLPPRIHSLFDSYTLISLGNHAFLTLSSDAWDHILYAVGYTHPTKEKYEVCFHFCSTKREMSKNMAKESRDQK